MSIELAKLHADTVAAGLDQDKPEWVTEWADQRSLQEFARGRISPNALRQRVIDSVIWPVLRATYQATVKDD